jgi:hypothetical protein
MWALKDKKYQRLNKKGIALNGWVKTTTEGSVSQELIPQLGLACN